MQRYKGQQYSQLYFFRIHTIRQFLTPLARERWPSLPGSSPKRRGGHYSKQFVLKIKKLGTHFVKEAWLFEGGVKWILLCDCNFNYHG